MMIRCKTAAELLCQSLDSPLSRWQRLQLRLHLWLCRPCAEFAKQNDMILESIEKRFAASQEEGLPDPQLEQLSREACERMKQRLREAMENDSATSQGDKSEHSDPRQP